MIRIIEHFFIFILLNCGMLYVSDTILFGSHFIVTGGWIGYGISALFLSLIQIFIKPVFQIILLPIRIITLGMIQFFINGFLLWILEFVLLKLDFFSVSLIINGFWIYILSGFLFALTHLVFQFFYSR